MSTKYRLSILALLLAFFSCAKATDEKASHLRGDPINIAMLRKSGDDSVIEDFYSRELVCRVDMIGLRGEYYFNSSPADAQTVCATYLLGESNDLVEIEFTQFNVDCNDPANILQFFDGWTMGVGQFPGDDDHPLPITERVINVCDQRQRVYRSHQNGAMITFRLGQPNASFRIAFRLINNPEPCNVIAPEPTGSHTLRNFGYERNCSFSIIYPTDVTIMEMSIGSEENDGTRLRCHDGLDYVELMEGNSLNMDTMKSETSLCGQVGNIVRQHGGGNPLNPNNQIVPGSPLCDARSVSMPLMCHNSVVRLVSSNQYENHVSFRFNQMPITRSACPEEEVV